LCFNGMKKIEFKNFGFKKEKCIIKELKEIDN
jgi:hypothetical protein